MTDLPMKADDDLVENKLRAWRKRMPLRWYGNADLDKAADAITSLRAQLAAAEARSDALEKLATENLNLSHKHFGALGRAEIKLQAMRKALETFLMCWDFDHGSWSLAALEAAKGRAKAALRSLTEGAEK